MNHMRGVGEMKGKQQKLVIVAMLLIGAFLFNGFTYQDFTYHGAAIEHNFDTEKHDNVDLNEVRTSFGRTRTEDRPIIELIVSKIVDSVIDEKDNDYEKIRALHDYIVLNTRYDVENIPERTHPIEAYSAYGALINGVAVCDGYTRAFRYLLNEVGIENHYVSGVAGSGGGHAWNIVKLDGEWYHVDTTWNDPIPDRPRRVRYKYFLVSDETLRTYDPGRTWDEDIPEATSEKYREIHSTARFDDSTELLFVFFDSATTTWISETDSTPPRLWARPVYYQQSQNAEIKSSDTDVLTLGENGELIPGVNGVAEVKAFYGGMEASHEVAVYNGVDREKPSINLRLKEVEIIEELSWGDTDFKLTIEWEEYEGGIYGDRIYYRVYAGPWIGFRDLIGIIEPGEKMEVNFQNRISWARHNEIWVEVLNKDVRHRSMIFGYESEGVIGTSNNVIINNENPERSLGEFNRIRGQNRFHTAAEISRHGWFESSEAVILANGTDFPDALAGSTLAYAKNAPILLTGKDVTPYDTLNEIRRLGPETIYLLGGQGVISKAQEEYLKSLNDSSYTVKRISGQDRFKTSIAIGNAVRDNNASQKAIITTGFNYPDALSVAPYAAMNNLPILFTQQGSLNSSTGEALTQWGIKEVIIVGGEGAVSEAVVEEIESLGVKVERIRGINRFETSVEIDKYFREGEKGDFYIATGLDFADALTGSVLAAKNNSPVFLTRPGSLPSVLREAVEGYKGSHYVLGGEGAVSKEILEELNK